jgi:hypothetical protein
VEEAIDFLEATVLKRLNVCHLIDAMHVEKNMCESLFGTLLNTDRKTRDHVYAQANIKKMGIRSELWLDDYVKGMELLTLCTTLLKYEEEFCGFLKKYENSIQLLDERLKTYFIARSKSSSRREVS